ncbi:MAG: hypothetical protein ACRD96_14255, partial [Bryobacteraceae bacterium]
MNAIELDEALAAECARPRVPSELLETPRAGRLVLYAIADWAGIAGLWLVEARLPAWLYPLWLLLAAGRFHALGVILHDAVHMA